MPTKTISKPVRSIKKTAPNKKITAKPITHPAGQQILEGSRAIALTVRNCRPAVVSAYPITPQTHIVEDLALFKAQGKADYEYVRGESEFAAASIVEGASATGVRTYTATSSQGLLLMTEVLYNIAGMRLPVVMTCANRAISAPISIWNDQQDAVTMRDSGWIMFYAETHQEAVMQHVLAYKIAEQLSLPVMINVDGFVLTHSYEPVVIPDEKMIKKFLPDFKPAKGAYLDPAHPVTLGAFAAPTHYFEIRQELHNDLIAGLKAINEEYGALMKLAGYGTDLPAAYIDNGLIEYQGPRNPKTVVIAMGSVIGTIKQLRKKMADDHVSAFMKKGNDFGIIKIKTYRPFPAEEVIRIIKNADQVAVIDKSISLGQMGPLALDVKAAAQGQTASFKTPKVKAKIKSYVVGLGGRDITQEMIRMIVKDVKKADDRMRFVGRI